MRNCYAAVMPACMDVHGGAPYNDKRFNPLGDANRVAFELKKTINLPKTAFPMKANLPQNEPKMLERWEQTGIYERIRESRKGAPRYVLPVSYTHLTLPTILRV